MRNGMAVLALAAAAVASLAPGRARGQNIIKEQGLIAAWDGPSFTPQGPENALGVYYIQPRHTDGGVAATWRSGTGLVLGVRGEYVHDPVFGAFWGVGGEARGGFGPVAPPLAFNWTAGVGALIGNGESDLRVPVGLTIGLRLVSGTLILTPFVHPRVSLAYVSFSNGGGSDTAFQFDTDVGADLRLTPGLILRVGGTFGDQPAFGAGIALGLGRF